MGSEEVKVVSFWVSPFGIRVEWALKLKGIEYEYIEEDIFNKSNLLLQLNPVHKKVPVLLHAHKPIAESFIILQYIDEIWKHYPLLPQHPYQRALVHFWANFGEQKLLDPSWIAMCSSGDDQENALKVARESMEKIEEEIKGKKFFGGDNIGYLDIALGWISYWLPVWEEVGSMQIMDPLKFPATNAWITNFLSHPVIKDNLPPRDKMLVYFAESPPFYPSPWVDPTTGDWSKAYERAKKFVSQLTLIEKVNLTTGTGWQSESCVGNVGAIPRLAFDALCLQDSPLGIRFADYVSAFPAGGTIAASWDRGEFYRRGNEMGKEHRAKGVDVQLGPAIGPLGRHPKGGRNWEGFSPDPVLSGHAVAETVRGIQDAGVIACTKHYLMNEQEHFRQPGQFEDFGFVDAISSNLDDKTLHELYLWPFADAIRAGTGSIMCSYNKVNNSQVCQNSYLQNYILKGELGFQGFIVSDWDAQHSGVSSTLAGLDMTMPGDTDFNSGYSFWGTNLTISILNGTVPQWRLDDAAVRIMTAYYYVGLDESIPVNFDSWSRDTYGYEHYFAQMGNKLINQHIDVRMDHFRSIRRSAAKSTVLLKNSGVLPLSGAEKWTAVFGEDAGENPWGPNGCPDRGCDMGTLAMGWGSGTADFTYLVTPLEAIKREVTDNGGVLTSVTDNYASAQIQAMAQQASHSIVFVNADSGEGYITVDGNMGDRNNLTVWHDGDTLVRNVSALCNNTIVVVHSVGVVTMDAWKDNENVTAILWAGLPGQESGHAIADILYGRRNPGGKLPFTIGSSQEQYGADVIYEPNNGHGSPQDNFEEGVFIDYRAFDKKNITPTYEFGFGLSYTTFEYSDLSVSKVKAGAYQPFSGQTRAAPTLGNYSRNIEEYQLPADFVRPATYIYPYLNSTDLKEASMDPEYGVNYTWPEGSVDGSPQARIAAGGAPGGNPQLWDVLFTIEATITNTGHVHGDEVVQAYISLGGPEDPVVQLRAFDRLSIQSGESATFHADITRRDISNWDTVSQNWVVSEYPKTIHVGASSRNLPLSAELDTSDLTS